MDIMQIMQDMASSEISIIAAFFIGLMMAISPCPLATNITAIAYISKNLADGKRVVLSGLFYTFGRMFAYTSIAALIVYFGMSVMDFSMFLQNNAEFILGLILLISGLVMLNWIKFGGLKIEGAKFEELKKNLATRGEMGAFALGFLFALAFCPFSAVLFFGMLIPIAIANSDAIIIPASFSIATGLPVLIFSFLLAWGAKTVGKYLGKIQVVEQNIRRFVGAIFVLVGLYYLIQMII